MWKAASTLARRRSELELHYATARRENQVVGKCRGGFHAGKWQWDRWCADWKKRRGGRGGGLGGPAAGPVLAAAGGGGSGPSRSGCRGIGRKRGWRGWRRRLVPGRVPPPRGRAPWGWGGRKPEISRKVRAGRRNGDLSLGADRTRAQRRATISLENDVCGAKSLKFRQARGGCYLPLPPAQETNEI